MAVVHNMPLIPLPPEFTPSRVPNMQGMHYPDERFSVGIGHQACPASLLPTELLREIFTFCMITRPRRSFTTGINREEPPRFCATAASLACVSSQWRAIATSMPELWTTISIDRPDRDCVLLTELYLSRSGSTLPLDLCLRQNLPHGMPTDYFQRAEPSVVVIGILELWIAQAHRWRSITLDLPHTYPYHALQSIPWDTFLRVEEADIRFGFPKRETQYLWHSIWRSPVLRIAYWHDIYPQPVTNELFPRLSEFMLGDRTPDEFFTVLSSCHRLKRISVSISSSNSLLSTTPIKSHTLECLDLELHEGALCVLDYISTPALRELRVVDKRTKPFIEASSLERLLERSGCSLSTLFLHIDRDTMSTSGKKETSIDSYLGHASRFLLGLETCSLAVDDPEAFDQVVFLFCREALIVPDSEISQSTESLVPFPSLVDLELITSSKKDETISHMVRSRLVNWALRWKFYSEVIRVPSTDERYSRGLTADDVQVKYKYHCQPWLYE